MSTTLTHRYDFKVFYAHARLEVTITGVTIKNNTDFYMMIIWMSFVRTTASTTIFSDCIKQSVFISKYGHAASISSLKKRISVKPELSTIK